MCRERVEQPAPERRHDARGASLASVLVLIVVLGGLAASAVVGVNAITGSDSSINGLASTSTTKARDGSGSVGRVGLGGPVAGAAAAACQVTGAAATAASSAYFVTSGGTYPKTWLDLTASSPPSFALPEQVVINARHPAELDGNGWKLVMSGGGATAPKFGCK